MNKVGNPMELLDRYLQAVRFWLPRTQREDLAAELGEDLRSQIDEKETELGHSLDETEVAAVLRRCGPPMAVASSLGERRYVVGPEVYPIYVFVMKVVLFWILIPLFVVVLGPVNAAMSASQWPNALGSTLAQLIPALFMAAGIITLVFAILERTLVPQLAGAQGPLAYKWDPLSLPPLENPERTPTRLDIVFGLFFSFLALIWLLLVPQYPFLILGPAAVILHAAPMWHFFYPTIVALSILTVVRSGMMLARPEWGLFPLSSQLVLEVLGFAVLCLMLNAGGARPGGEWQPFVVLAEGLRNDPNYHKVPGIVNISILITVLVCWFVQGIAIIVHAWQLLQRMRERKNVAGHPARLQAQ